MADMHPRPGGPGNDNLERYWKHGEGAAKIRWGTDGDFTRCHIHLAKYLGPERAARVCATWHRDMVGFFPGAHGGQNPNGPG